VKLNFKQLKKISQDDTYAVFKDTRGNEVKVSHKTLSPKLKAELDALPVHMADGGEVIKSKEGKGPAIIKKSAEEVQKGATSSGFLGLDKYVDNFKKGLQKPKAMNKGGDPRTDGKEIDPASLITDLNAEMASEGPVPGLNQGIIPDAFSPAMAETVLSQAAPAMPMAAPVAPAPDQGLAPVAPAAALPEVSSQADPVPMMQQGVASIKEGLGVEAKAIQDQAKAEQAAIEESQRAQQDIMSDFQSRMRKLEGERNAVMEDVKAGNIDPNRLWNSRSGAQKVATAIGILASGLGAGLSGQENMALKVVQAEIDRDIDAQKANLHNKNNLLSAISSQMGDLRQSTEMLRSIKLGMAADEMKKAAAMAKDPMAKANLLKSAGELDMKAAPILAKTAAQQTASRLMQAANKDPRLAQQAINAMRAVDPEKADEMAKKLVPGMGFVGSEKDATSIKEVKDRETTIMDNIAQVEKMIKDSGTYEAMGSHNADMERLTDAIAVDMAKLMDPNSVARPGEVELMKKGLPAVGISGRNSTALSMLKNLKGEVQKRAKSAYSIRGIDYMTEADKTDRLKALRAKQGK
jgi:hypothetical protein